MGVELEGLVPSIMYKKTRYNHPLEPANKYATILKQELQCDYVICLSHLGYSYDKKMCDLVLAKQSKNIVNYFS